MRIARYWSMAHHTLGEISRSAWGSSDVSQANAEADAARRAVHACEVALSGGRPGRANDTWYYPERALPELVVERIERPRGDLAAAITINRYGASILNTDAVAFVDVDCPEQTSVGVVGRLFGARTQAGPEPQDYLDRLAAWAREAPGRGARAYRTAGGLRYLVITPHLRPKAPETEALMRRLGADELYTRLCAAQDCFRARLTPKPWRLGLETRHLPYGRLARSEPDDERWLARYAEMSREYAVCRLIDTFGDARPRDEISTRIIDLHDAMTIGSPDQTLA